MHTSETITIEGSPFPYIRYGKGSKLLIAIPGYGDRKETFLKLQESLSPNYLVYALELPGHGESDWSRDQFYQSDFEKVIRAILLKEKKDRLTLMGHSFGGRAILSLLPKLYEVVDELFLLAPDGLDEGYMRRATLVPLSIRHLTQRFLKKPSWYIGLVKALNKIGLLKNHSYQFVKLNFANASRRKRLFLYWNSIDDFKIDTTACARILNKEKIPTHIILGNRDFVIPGAAWKDWAKGLEKVKLTELDEDHRLIGEELDEYLKGL